MTERAGHTAFLHCDPDRLRGPLRAASAAFLALPVAIFLAGWLRPTVAVVLLAAVAVAFGGLVGRGTLARPGAGRPRTVSLQGLLLALAPGGALALVSGAGGFGSRNWDWVKHDAVLRDLVLQVWPVRYLTESGTTALVYYVAYYLPAATIGKLAGWVAANLALVATSLAGTALAALWLVVLSRGAPLLCGWLFALFSGMDLLGAAIVGGWPPHLARLFADFHLEWWASHWQYSSTASLLYFVPNQALAGWLIVALLLDAFQRKRDRFPLVALLALGLLWSPFVVIGTLPLALAFLVSPHRTLGASVRAQLTVANLAGAIVGGTVALYFASRLGGLPLPARYHPATSPLTRGDFQLLPIALEPVAFLANYAVFVTCEFLVLWLLLLRAHREAHTDDGFRPILVAAGAALLALPFFRWGLFNDLVMRASIPALFVLLVAAARALRDGARGGLRATIAVVLAVGALYGGNLLRMNGAWVLHARRLQAIPPVSAVRNLFQVQIHDPAAQRREFVAQYLGAADAPFFRWLARRSPAVRVDRPERGPAP